MVGILTSVKWLARAAASPRRVATHGHLPRPWMPLTHLRLLSARMANPTKSARDVKAEQLPLVPGGRVFWRDAVRSLTAAVQPIAPAVVLLWLPPLIGLFGGLPGADRPGHTALSFPALMAGGLAPLWVTAGWFRLRGRSLAGMVTLLRSEGWPGRAPRPIRCPCLHAHALLRQLRELEVHDTVALPGLPLGCATGVAGDLGARRSRGQAPGAPVRVSPGHRAAGSPLSHLVRDAVRTGDMAGLGRRPEGNLRQFWTAFALIWILLGILLAFGLASAGPIYARLDRGSTSYDDLLARLSAAEEMAPLFVRVSALSLWQAARQPGCRWGTGSRPSPACTSQWPPWRRSRCGECIACSVSSEGATRSSSWSDRSCLAGTTRWMGKPGSWERHSSG